MQRIGPDGTVNYLYDNNGNLTQQSITGADGVITCYDYTFNELNQLVKVTKNGRLIADYFYDEKGLRYKKIDYLATETKTTIYVYGQGTEPMYEEVYSSTNLTAPVSAVSYLNMGAKRLGRWENGAMKYYFTDHLGSTRIVMDSAGKCTYQDYDPFGGDFGATSSERYKFTRKGVDEIGLYYYGARYYDPATGRFTSEDAAKDGFNWYVYCQNNPMNYMDSDGKLSNDPNDYKSESQTTNFTNNNLKFSPSGEVSWSDYTMSLLTMKDTTTNTLKGSNVLLTLGKTYFTKGSPSTIAKAASSVAGPMIALDYVIGIQQQNKITKINEISRNIAFANKSIGFSLEKQVTHVKSWMYNHVSWVVLGEGDINRYFIHFLDKKYFVVPKTFEIDQTTYDKLLECSGGKK